MSMCDEVAAVSLPGEPRRWERTARLAEAGWRTEDIAEWMGVGVSVIYRRLSLMGCSRPQGRAPGSVPRSPDTQRRYDEVAKRWHDGHSTGTIGRQLGITHQRVSQILIAVGIHPGRRRHDCHRRRCAEIRQMRDDGISWAAIDQHLGQVACVQVVKFHPELRRRQRHRCRPYCQKVLDLYAAGKGTGRVAKELGLFQSRVYLILHYHGVTTRRRGYTKGGPRIRYEVMEAIG